MSTATISPAKPKTAARSGKRPQLASLVWEDFQQEIDSNRILLTGRTVEKQKACLLDLYKAFLLKRLNPRTYKKEMLQYFSASMQEAIYNKTVDYLCEPFMPVSDFSMIENLHERTRAVKIFIVGTSIRLQYDGAIVIDNKDFDRNHSPFYNSMKDFANHVTGLLRAQGVTVTEVKTFKTWELANKYKDESSNHRISKSSNSKSVRSKTETAVRHQRAGGGSNPSGRSNKKSVNPKVSEKKPAKLGKQQRAFLELVAGGGGHNGRIAQAELDAASTPNNQHSARSKPSGHIDLSAYIVKQVTTKGGYPGSKNGHGVKQTIRNQVPEYKIFISGFLGNDPLFRELPVHAANYAFETSEQTIAEYWPDFKRSSAAKSSYVSGEDTAMISKGIFPPHMYANRYLNATANKAIFTFDFLKWFAAAAAKLDCTTLTYLDPPFLISTQKNVERDYYGKRILTDHQHRELLKLARTTKALVAISCYDNPLYQKMLPAPKWRKITYQGRTHGGPVEETLYMNYPEPVKLADYSCIGDNHVTRQTFKRKVQRQMDKLARMNEKERNAILAAIRVKYPA